VGDGRLLEAHFQTDNEAPEHHAEGDVPGGTAPYDGVKLVRRISDGRYKKTSRENKPGHRVTPGEIEYEWGTLEPPAEKIK
jgi:hypothetical protein